MVMISENMYDNHFDEVELHGYGGIKCVCKLYM